MASTHSTVSQVLEDKVWNAYIDEYGVEPVTMSQLHNFAKGPNNPHNKISFRAVSKLFKRNQDKGKVSIHETHSEKPQSNAHEDDEIHRLKTENTQIKQQNEELTKRLNELLAPKEDTQSDIDNKEPQKESPVKPAENRKKETELWQLITQKIETGDEDYVRQILNQGVVTVNSVKKSGFSRLWNEDSMLIIASKSGQYRIAQMLLNLGADVNYRGRSRDALECAQVNGHHHVVKLLMLSKMDASASGQINDIATQLNTQKGVMHYLYQAAGRQEHGEAAFDAIVHMMVDIIHKRQAFSDDILNLAFDYSIHKALKSVRAAGEGESNDDHKGKSKESEAIDRDIVISTDLWQCIYNTCVEIITNKKHDKLEWFWLKKYLLNSTIWLRQFKDKRNNDELNSLYFELLDIVTTQASMQVDIYLKQPFKKIAHQNTSDWYALRAFDVHTAHKGAVRQDAIQNGHKAHYNRDILGKKCVNIDPFDAFNHYDTRQYLSALVLTARMVNSEFQKDIIQIFGINIKTFVGKFNAIYKEGPVKLLSRCQAKAEVDYKNEKFPTSAHVLDINRCSLIFEDIRSMLNGLKLFDEAIQNHKENKICITEIIRCKNGWKEYNHETPTYADIKFNVVIEGEYHSIIGEVQFLLRSMMEFKNKQHPLYSIERKKEFITSLADILPFLTDIPKTLNVNATLGNTNGICDAMVTHDLNVGDIVTNDDENNIFDLLCFAGHVRALKFLIEIMPNQLIQERIRFIHNSGYRILEKGGKDGCFPPHSLLTIVANTGKRQVLQLLFRQKCITECIDDAMWLEMFENMLHEGAMISSNYWRGNWRCDCETIRMILAIDNLYQKIPKNAWDIAIWRALRYGKKEYFELFTNLCDANILKELMFSEDYLQTAASGLCDEYRLELTQRIINFPGFKEKVNDRHIVDALWCAVRQININIFKLICDSLIKGKHDTVERYLLIPHSIHRETTLQCACKDAARFDFIELLLSHMTDANITKYVNYNGGECTAIAYAARTGETRTIERLLQISGIDVFGENEEKSSCSITEAIAHGNMDIAEELYRKLSDAQKQYKYDSKVLWDIAADTVRNSDIKSLKFVIDKLARNATDILTKCVDRKRSLIEVAVQDCRGNDMIEMVKYLCSVIPTHAIKDLITYDIFPYSMQRALIDVELLQFLATIPGVELHLLREDKNTLFTLALTSGGKERFKIVEFLFAQHKTQEDKLRTLRQFNTGYWDKESKPKLVAMALKHLDFSTIAVSALNDESEFGENVMRWSAKLRIVEFIDILLQINGIVVKPDAVLEPITVQGSKYNLELPITQKLYQYVRSTGQQTIDFDKDKLFTMVRLLCLGEVEETQSISVMKFIVGTLMNNAKEVSDLLMMKDEEHAYLLRQSIDRSVLLSAIKFKKIEFCKYIMSLLPTNKILDELNYQNAAGRSVLEYAAKNGCIYFLEYIAQKYEDVNMTQCNSQDGNTPFHVAARNAHINVCKFILSQCVDDEQRVAVINFKNKKDETPVMVAKNKSVQIEIQKWKTQFMG